MNIDEKLGKAFRIIAGLQNRGGGAGQILTGYQCFRCDQEKTHSDTAVPIICPKCVKEIRDKWRNSEKKDGA